MNCLLDVWHLLLGLHILLSHGGSSALGSLHSVMPLWKHEKAGQHRIYMLIYPMLSFLQGVLELGRDNLT
jgi:hypothetical protein